MWKLNVAQIFQKIAKKSAKQFLTKSYVFKVAQKVTKYLGYFWKQNLSPKSVKIAQSGHTG